MPESSAVPEWVWGGADYTSVHAAVLFARLDEGLQISSTLSPVEYDTLLNGLQATAISLAQKLRAQGYPLAEWHVEGDQAAFYFYDPSEVERNYQLDGPQQPMGEQRSRLVAECRRSNEALAYHALKSAIQFKNDWLVHELNLKRVMSHLEPWELQVALHHGWARLGARPDGRQRIEGYTVNLGRHLLHTAPGACYSRIFASQHFHDALRGSVVKHTQLRQRAVFHACEAAGRVEPSLARQLRMYELKFCHRIGVAVSEEVVEQYDAIFNLGHANMWAYHQLVEYHGYTKRDWNKVFNLSKAAQLAHPGDEKILLDLAKYYYEQNKLEQSRQFAEEALRFNDTFDLAHEHLAMIASKQDDIPAQIGHWRNAVRLSPGSPVNNFNLGLALLCDGQDSEGFHYIQEALRIYPEYRRWDAFTSALHDVRREGKLPELLEAYLEPEEQLLQVA